MQKSTPAASPKVAPAKLPAANPSMKKTVSADGVATKVPSSPSKSPTSALQPPGVPNTRLTPLTPEPMKRTVSELKKPAHAGVAGSPVAAGRASPKLAVSASTPSLHKNTEIAKLPAKKTPAHVKTDSTSSNLSAGTASPSASPATPNTSLASLLPKSPSAGVDNVFSARTEVAMAHEVVRQNREKAASEAAAVEAAAKAEAAAVETAAKAEQDAIQAEWERSRKAENDRINAEIARLAKEKEDEEDRKTLAMMEATLASHGIKRESSSVVAKDQAEALAAHRAAEKIAAEQAAKDLKETRAARRATLNTSLEVSPTAEKKTPLRNDAEADKTSGTHLPAVSLNGSRSHTPQLSDSRRLVNSSSNAGDKSPREQQEAASSTTTKPASRSPVASNRSSLLPAAATAAGAEGANTLLPPTIKSRSRSGSITNASADALFNRLSQPNPNHIAAQPASSVSKSPKMAGFRSIASDSQASPAANRSSPSSSPPTGSPSVTAKSREDEHLESLANDPLFAALKDTKDENVRGRSPSKSRKRRTNGSGGSRSPVQVNSRRSSLTAKEMAMVPGFLKQVNDLDSLLEKNRLTGGARTPVLDGSAEATQAVKDLLSGNTAAAKQEEEDVRRKSWSNNLVPACAHEVFEKYKEKLLKCRLTLQEGVEKGNVTGLRMNEALAFIRENDRHSAHSQFIFEAGFEAGKAAAREQARLELEAAVKAAKDAAMGITKENAAAQAQPESSGPKVDTSDKVLTAQGIVVVETVHSP